MYNFSWFAFSFFLLNNTVSNLKLKNLMEVMIKKKIERLFGLLLKCKKYASQKKLVFLCAWNIFNKKRELKLKFLFIYDIH